MTKTKPDLEAVLLKTLEGLETSRDVWSTTDEYAVMSRHAGANGVAYELVRQMPKGKQKEYFVKLNHIKTAMREAVTGRTFIKPNGNPISLVMAWENEEIEFEGM